MRYASLCLLSYNRPQFLYDSLRSLHETAGYPFELIAHDDGTTEPGIGGFFEHLLNEGIISSLVRNPPGQNQGVGCAMRKTFSLASGDPIIKLDQDLIFNRAGWLAETVEILRRNRKEWEETYTTATTHVKPIGVLGAFHYTVPPCEASAMHVADHGYYEEVADFVGSFIAVPRWVYETQGPFETHSEAFAEDIAFKKKCQEHGLVLALPPEDFCINRGFGPGPSTVVYHDGDDSEVRVAQIKKAPVLFTPDR